MLLQIFPIMDFYSLQDAGVVCLLGLWQLLGTQGSHRVPARGSRALTLFTCTSQGFGLINNNSLCITVILSQISAFVLHPAVQSASAQPLVRAGIELPGVLRAGQSPQGCQN